MNTYEFVAVVFYQINITNTNNIMVNLFMLKNY